MRSNFLKQPQHSSHSLAEEQESQASFMADNEKKRDAFPLHIEDLSAFYLGRCCLREACYFATPLLKMRFCPYCATEMKTVYDFFAMFHLPSSEPFSLEPAKKRYRQLLSMFHPDLEENQNQSENSVQNDQHSRDFLLVSEAWQTLGNDDLRQEYRKILAKCRTSLLMEQDFAAGKESEKKSATRSLFFSLRAVNSFLAGCCFLAAAWWLYGCWGKNWQMLGGVSFILLTIVSFSWLYKIFSVVIFGGLLGSFCYFFLQEQSWMALLFLAGAVVFLHFNKKWNDSLKVSPD